MVRDVIFIPSTREPCHGSMPIVHVTTVTSNVLASPRVMCLPVSSMIATYWVSACVSPQRLKVAEVAALLSIAQELSALNPQNTSTRDEEGDELNCWGIITKKAQSKPGKLRTL
jgi:hypothetical protein